MCLFLILSIRFWFRVGFEAANLLLDSSHQGWDSRSGGRWEREKVKRTLHMRIYSRDLVPARARVWISALVSGRLRRMATGSCHVTIWRSLIFAAGRWSGTPAAPRIQSAQLESVAMVAISCCFSRQTSCTRIELFGKLQLCPISYAILHAFKCVKLAAYSVPSEIRTC